MNSDESERLARLMWATLRAQLWKQDPGRNHLCDWEHLMPFEQRVYRETAEVVAKDIMEGDRKQLVEATRQHAGTSWGEAIEEVGRIYLLAWESLPKVNAELAAANELVAKLSRMRDTPLQRISVAEGMAKLAALGVTIDLTAADLRGDEVPWAECYIAFDIEGDDKAIWAANADKTLGLPDGWSLHSVELSGGKGVVNFRVEGQPSEEDGLAVAARLAELAMPVSDDDIPRCAECGAHLTWDEVEEGEEDLCPVCGGDEEGLGEPCEGCRRPAVVRDSDDVPLCQTCSDACDEVEEPVQGPLQEPQLLVMEVVQSLTRDVLPFASTATPAEAAMLSALDPVVSICPECLRPVHQSEVGLPACPGCGVA